MFMKTHHYLAHFLVLQVNLFQIMLFFLSHEFSMKIKENVKRTSLYEVVFDSGKNLHYELG